MSAFVGFHLADSCLQSPQLIVKLAGVAQIDLEPLAIPQLHIRKAGKSRYIVLSHDDIRPIPVSKSYFKNLITKIDKYNNVALKEGKSALADAETTEELSKEA